MSRGIKITVWVVIAAVVVAAFVVTGARRLRKQEVRSVETVQEAEGIPVDVVRARAMPVEDWREFVGVAQGEDQVDLMAPFRTRVDGVHAEVGDEVPAGTVVVTLDPYDPARIGMNFRTAEAQYETARQDSLRIEALYRSGAVSEQDLDHVRASTEAARAQYLTARRAVKMDTPIAGVVTSLIVEEGDYAEAEETVATVSSYDRVRIPVEVSEAEQALIALGQKVRVRLGERRTGTRGCPAGSTDGRAAVGGNIGPVLLGRVTKVALSADPSTRLFAVEVVVDNPDHLLKPGTLVTPEILVAATGDEPVVPPVAVLRHNSREHLYVVDDSGGHPVARLRGIVRGVENGALVAISEGLEPGERVVVWGQNNLDDGVKIKIHADVTSQYLETGR